MNSGRRWRRRPRAASGAARIGNGPAVEAHRMRARSRRRHCLTLPWSRATIRCRSSCARRGSVRIHGPRSARRADSVPGPATRPTTTSRSLRRGRSPSPRRLAAMSLSVVAVDQGNRRVRNPRRTIPDQPPLARDDAVGDIVLHHASIAPLRPGRPARWVSTTIVRSLRHAGRIEQHFLQAHAVQGMPTVRSGQSEQVHERRQDVHRRGQGGYIARRGRPSRRFRRFFHRQKHGTLCPPS